jgi:tRNA(fMet)-specific endonuclease VapC
VLVAVERSRATLDELIPDQDDTAMAGVTAAELLLGVELGEGRDLRRRRAFIEQLLEAIPVETYGLEVARSHAGLLAATRRAGRPRSAHDLIIAATALASDRTVVTMDRRGFDGLPGVDVRVPPG